jgi:hypothetical protein
MTDSLDRLFADVQEARDRNPSTSRTAKLCGVSPADVMGEIDRRERVYGIAEKLPKQASVAQIRRMAPWAVRRKAS